MKLPAIAFALTVLWIVVPAEARGIDCAKAATALEKTICGDKQLLQADDDIAVYYAMALKAYDGKIADYVRRDHQNWRRTFVAIGKPDSEVEPWCELKDKSCILTEMTRRRDELGSGTYQNSGVYRSAKGYKLLLYPRFGNGFSVKAFNPAAGQKAINTLDEDRAALWDGPEFLVAKMGDANRLDLPDFDGCELRMLPSVASIRVWQKGSCQGQDFAGTYQRTGELLAEYEVDLH